MLPKAASPHQQLFAGQQPLAFDGPLRLPHNLLFELLRTDPERALIAFPNALLPIWIVPEPLAILCLRDPLARLAVPLAVAVDVPMAVAPVYCLPLTLPRHCQ